jgi:hypothetical protein
MMMTQAAMTTTKLSLVAGAALMLAALPAFAQTNTQPGTMNGNPGMTPKSSMGTSAGGMHASDHAQDTHQSMSPHHAMRGGRNDGSQNAAVDRLNDQSFQAAQQGQNFTPGSSSGGSAMPASDSMGRGNMAPGGSGGMNQPNSGASGSGSGKM